MEKLDRPKPPWERSTTTYSLIGELPQDGSAANLRRSTLQQPSIGMEKLHKTDRPQTPWERSTITNSLIGELSQDGSAANLRGSTLQQPSIVMEKLHKTDRPQTSVEAFYNHLQPYWRTFSRRIGRKPPSKHSATT